jgi:hypothetical protein
VLGFFLLAWVSLLMILVAAPEVYDQALRLPGSRGAATIAFLAVLTGFLALLAVAVVRRWRWAFWLILVAFLAGVLRVPVAILQLTGTLPADAPTWYVAFQGLIMGAATPSRRRGRHAGHAQGRSHRRPVVRPVRDRRGRFPAWG